MLERIPFLRGTTPWILMDFRSPRRQLPRIQDFFNRKGLVSDRGQKKKAFFVMQRFYARAGRPWAAPGHDDDGAEEVGGRGDTGRDRAEAG